MVRYLASRTDWALSFDVDPDDPTPPHVVACTVIAERLGIDPSQVNIHFPSVKPIADRTQGTVTPASN